MVVRCFKSEKDSGILVFNEHLFLGKDGGSDGNSAPGCRLVCLESVVCDGEQHSGGALPLSAMKVSHFFCSHPSQLEQERQERHLEPLL